MKEPENHQDKLDQSSSSTSNDSKSKSSKISPFLKKQPTIYDHFYGTKYLSKNGKNYEKKTNTHYILDSNQQLVGFRLFNDKDLGFQIKVQQLINSHSLDNDIQTDSEMVEDYIQSGILQLQQAIDENNQQSSSQLRRSKRIAAKNKQRKQNTKISDQTNKASGQKTN